MTLSRTLKTSMSPLPQDDWHFILLIECRLENPATEGRKHLQWRSGPDSGGVGLVDPVPEPVPQLVPGDIADVVLAAAADHVQQQGAVQFPGGIEGGRLRRSSSSWSAVAVARQESTTRRATSSIRPSSIRTGNSPPNPWPVTGACPVVVE